MHAARHDHDRMTINEAIALAQGAGLGIAMVLEGPAVWLTEPMAPVVIVYVLASLLVVAGRSAIVQIRRRLARRVPFIEVRPTQLESSVVA
jgi:hypothetical protein